MYGQVDKNSHILLKKIHFEALFPKGHLHTICFLYILNIYPKCLLFQFLSVGIHVLIQGHLYASCLLYILSYCFKCFLIQF